MQKLPRGSLAHLRLRLGRDWRFIVRHAWSIRLMALAIILDVAAAALPLFAGTSIELTVSLVALSGLISMAAFVARFVAQKGFDDADS